MVEIQPYNMLQGVRTVTLQLSAVIKNLRN